MADAQAAISLNRSRHLADILVRHGLGYLVGILGLERFVPFHRGLLGYPRRGAPRTRPEHLRMALEELGATFIKLGQILSTRADLLPAEYQAELAKLQDAAAPLPWEVIQETLGMELGQPLSACFATFDSTPLAAASIGQVHAATLPDGAEVVVKVRRPGVVEQVKEDLAILQNLAATASRRSSLADQYDLVGLAQEFAETLRGTRLHPRGPQRRALRCDLRGRPGHPHSAGILGNHHGPCADAGAHPGRQDRRSGRSGCVGRRSRRVG